MSRTLQLTPRLRMVADLLPRDVVLVDVGTDHAYLPAVLLLEGKIRGAIAADLRPGPLNRARATVEELGLEGKVKFCLCDGLAEISPREADAVAIAGMGGETIAAILAAAPWTRDMGTLLVLQPMSSMADLRGWLGTHGYRIEAEELSCEGDTLYTAMAVRAGEMGPMTDAERWVGRNSPHPLRGKWLDQWLKRVERALSGMGQAREDRAAHRRVELERVRTGLLEMKREWQEWQM